MEPVEAQLMTKIWGVGRVLYAKALILGKILTKTKQHILPRVPLTLSQIASGTAQNLIFWKPQDTSFETWRDRL